MAEFCYQCTEDVLKIPGHHNDFAGMGDKKLHEQGKHCNVLCEGCGHIQTDYFGKRVGPSPVKLQKDLDTWWRTHRGSGQVELEDGDRADLLVIVYDAIRESGHDPSDFEVVVDLDEDNPAKIDWSYSKK